MATYLGLETRLDSIRVGDFAACFVTHKPYHSSKPINSGRIVLDSSPADRLYANYYSGVYDNHITYLQYEDQYYLTRVATLKPNSKYGVVTLKLGMNEGCTATNYLGLRVYPDATNTNTGTYVFTVKDLVWSSKPICGDKNYVEIAADNCSVEQMASQFLAGAYDHRLTFVTMDGRYYIAPVARFRSNTPDSHKFMSLVPGLN